MRKTTTVMIAVSLVSILSGCSSTKSIAPNLSHPTNTTAGSVLSSANALLSNTANDISEPNPWPGVDWVLTDSLMKQKHWMTEYNNQLAINQGVYGERYNYSDWHLPPKWLPYLYHNEHWILSSSQPMYLNHKTLFITLQGTVFLKDGVAGRYWPPLSVADIPPDATIVAEFVPLKPAVQAGVIPVYHSFPQTESTDAAVLNALGMTQTQYQHDIGTPNPK